MALAQINLQSQLFTEEEYFAFEKDALGRWEYFRGVIYAMAGGSDDHNTIAGNIGRLLGNALVPRGCRVYGSDMKIHTGDGANTFPDAMVVCGERQYHQGRTDIVSNPTLVVEVLSPSTENYDRNGKFVHYASVPLLTEYLLASQDAPHLMLYSRVSGVWENREAQGIDDAILLPTLGVTLALSDVYALLDFA